MLWFRNALIALFLVNNTSSSTKISAGAHADVCMRAYGHQRSLLNVFPNPSSPHFSEVEFLTEPGVQIG